jgi:uncharacterized metal-binding protein YceD (DUF177 family)
MNQDRAYEIAFVGLSPGLHEFEYRIEDQFFTSFGQQDFSNCNTLVRLKLDKKQGFFQLHFDVDGKIDTLCDRCGNPLTIQLWDEFNLIVKLVDDPITMNSQEEDADIFYVDKGENYFSIAAWIYEFINLSIPLQHICKETEKGESTCNQKVLDQLNQFKVNPTEVNNKNIWKGLEKFKGLDETNEEEINKN